MPFPSDVPIESAAGPAPAPAAAPAAPAAAEPAPAPVEDTEEPAKLPDDVVSNPIVKQVITGEVPGVLVRPGIYYPKASKVAEHAEALMDLGMDFYRAFDNSVVFFNPRVITEQQLKAADEQGQLVNVVPDYETLSGEKPAKPPPEVAKRLRQSMGAPEGAAEGLRPPSAAANAVPPSGGGMSSAQEAQLAGKRATNMQPGAPTSGPRPGAGRILAGLSKPAI